MEANFSSHSSSAAGSSSSNSFRGTGGPSKISDMLIRHVEVVLFAITDNGFCSDMLPNRVKLSDIVQPLTSDFSKIFDGISEGAKVISDQMSASSKLSGEAFKIAKDVVQALGNFHFASAALLAIATVLERVEKISANDRDCLDLIKAMLDLAKSIKQLTDINLHSTQRALSEKMTEAVHVIYVGAIMCRSFLISKHIWKFLLTTKVRDELVRLWRKVDSIKLDLVLQMQIMVMYSLSSQNSFSQLPFSLHEGLRGPAEESRLVQNMEVTEEDGIEQRRQPELGAPVQNLLLPESGCVADEMEVATLFLRISKLLKRITPKRNQTGARTILGMKLGTTYFGRNKRNTDTRHEPDVELDECFAKGPRRYSYAELAAATGNFTEHLGHGGFGTVYKGILAGTNETLAVKRISHWSKQGKKAYDSEINITSQLRHRNLVQLLGWCHKKDDLLLVYKFVPKGSLDKYLFAEHSGTTHLSWKRRHSIACDVASALVYLHEDWEQCVVHRDVKSSNVLLDSNFTAKLSDFGLARLMESDHEATHTTGVAGTVGYMAPEIITTGKATPQSDVFSFGALALEIACGKRPLDISLTEHSCRVVQWVWDLFGQGKILEAADKKLDGDFKSEEMERLMAVGLLCSHPDPKARPAMRHVLRILKFEVELPYVPLNFPVAVYNDPFRPAGSSTVTELALNSSAATIWSS